ncbi:GxxExxY protein [Thiohalomonas denitrificans]|uniref:GxxExxY protein n=1 Tax=Thiohalomonas denitrificans TaxID=415747 RepID=A0A1G5PR52_9GAMM|nr:GxxExxY protein [Thiohalomonas denitrificans]SCZ51640.1 GxxExxY protein [Thiohalomonas denitrificans]
MEVNRLAKEIVDSAIEVHRHLGPGLLESAYESSLCHELSIRGLPFARQVSLPVTYKGQRLASGYRLDMVVGDALAVELKAVDRLEPIHTAQLLTYLKLSDYRLGLLLNFNVRLMKDGIKRVANGM